MDSVITVASQQVDSISPLFLALNTKPGATSVFNKNWFID